MLQGQIQTTVTTALADSGGQVSEEALAPVLRQFGGVYFPMGAFRMPEKPTADSVIQTMYALALAAYEKKEETYTPQVMRELERVIMLRVVDEYWMDNIDAMDDLKQGIGLRAYGQHDPVIAYKEEGYEMFQAMIAAIREETVRRLFLVQLRTNQEVRRQKVAKETGSVGAPDTTMRRVPVRNNKKIGPNEPCPCGSGKKYKKCCMHKDRVAGMEQNKE